ncbi:hypothetical protein G7Z17_g9532 [Cylindrodendrum hubeiense]|uniref:Uncharacterized protein n=1 Tax=Cylindrodendrum hubeiense TaxID=595255 RepID=A0A9P5H8Z8_9HYPO|nr:hypothetical protein G7Z17_g9532 [Cylindrodendrum hubeiense]
MQSSVNAITLVHDKEDHERRLRSAIHLRVGRMWVAGRNKERAASTGTPGQPANHLRNKLPSIVAAWAGAGLDAARRNHACWEGGNAACGMRHAGTSGTAGSGNAQNRPANKTPIKAQEAWNRCYRN